MVRPEDETETETASTDLAPMRVTREQILEVLDKALRRELPLSEAYLFVVDIVDAVSSGGTHLEDEEMAEPLRALASLSVLTHDILDELRQRLNRPRDSGRA